MPQHTVVQLESLVVAGESDADAGRAASRSTVMPDMPIRPVTGGALRDFILEQSRIRDIGKVLSLRSRPGFSVIGDDAAQRRAVARAALCSVAAYHSPAEVKILLVTRHPEHWAWL
ncbi:hypothetical protein, partial [Mycolicibacterium insubricum]|uniref:hypothetical protein n=1 Tax=Mycolicibacterium insubricum TaxID=444597 RepID=UPI0021F29CDB